MERFFQILDEYYWQFNQIAIFDVPGPWVEVLAMRGCPAEVGGVGRGEPSNMITGEIYQIVNIILVI